MTKLWYLAASLMMSAGAIVSMTDDPPTPPSVPAVPSTAADDDPGGISVAWAPALADDPTSNLRTAYVLLRQIRDQRLEEKPKTLANRAIGFYREGIKALEQGDLVTARNLGAASLELAQAVELARVARAAEDDQELPAPPAAVRFRYVVNAEETKTDGEPARVHLELAPMLNGELLTQGVVTATPGDAKQDKHARILVTPSGAGGAASIRSLPQGASFVTGRVTAGEGKHEFTINLPKEDVLKGVMELRAEKLGDLTIAPRVVLGAFGNEQVLVQRLTADDQAVQARHELQKAYDAIRAARAKYKGTDDKIYLDTARDLYNAARREVEAGRHARALELIRASMSLVRVPGLLHDEPKAAEGGEVKRRVDVRVVPPAKDENGEERKIELRLVPEVKVEKGEQKKLELRVAPRAADRGETKGRIRIETRTRTTGPDGKVTEDVKVEEHEIGPDGVVRVLKPQAAAERDVATLKPDGAGEREVSIVKPEGAADDAGELVGVGLMLELEDDEIIIREVLPGGPAAKIGSIKAGDRLIGVEVKPGEVHRFAGKDLGEIVKLVRGEKGSKVRLVVLSQGSDDEKVVEIVRDRLDVQHVEGDDKSGEAKDSQTFRFEIPGGQPGAAGGRVRFNVQPLLRRFSTRTVPLGSGRLRLELEDDDRPSEAAKDPAPKEKEKHKPSLPPAIEA